MTIVIITTVTTFLISKYIYANLLSRDVTLKRICSHFVVIYFSRGNSSNISDAESSLNTGPPQISALVAYSKGFACACGAGTVYLFEKTDDKDFFKKVREIKVKTSCTKC